MNSIHQPVFDGEAKTAVVAAYIVEEDMAYRIKKQKVNRKFLYTVIKTQQARLNQLHETMQGMRTAVTQQADEFAATVKALEPITLERDALRAVVERLAPVAPVAPAAVPVPTPC